MLIRPSKSTNELILITVKIFTKPHFTLADIGNEKILPVATLHH